MKRRAPTASSCSAITPGKEKFVPAANDAAPDPSTPPPLQQSASPEMPLPSASKRPRMKIGVSIAARRKSPDSIASSASSISSSRGEVVYGSPVLGLAVGRFRDRRKTRPTAILTTVDATGCGGGDDAVCLTLRPAMASVRWLGDESFQQDKENESSFEFPLAGEESIEESDKDFFKDKTIETGRSRNKQQQQPRRPQLDDGILESPKVDKMCSRICGKGRVLKNTTNTASPKKSICQLGRFI